MIDMKTWEEIEADVVEELHLDPRNVRLSTSLEAPQTDIIEDLFANENALALVEGIVKIGYLTNEVPIVVRRDGQLIVVEGNRRVAALKAIQNPQLVRLYRAKISTLTATIPDRDELRTITVKVAPSQDDADQLIAVLHTTNLREPWTPLRQAAFFQAQVDAGKTLSQLTSSYPIPNVRRFVLRSQIFNLFKNANYSRPELSDLVRARKFPITTLARIYESSSFVEITGVRLDDNGELTMDIQPGVFMQMAEHIISGMAEKSLTARLLNTTDSPGFLALMADLQRIKDEAATQNRGRKKPRKESSAKSAPDHDGSRSGTSEGTGQARGQESGPGSGASGNAAGRQERPSSGEPEPKGSSGHKSPPSKFLDTGHLATPGVYPQAISLILQELSALNIEKFPNATFDLMRTFLEKTIKAYAERLSVDIRTTSNNQGGANNLNGFVQLSHCLNWLELHFQANGPVALVQVVRRVKSGRLTDFIGSAEYMNAINHNHHIFATADDVRTGWSAMDSLIREMLKQ